MKHLFAVLLLLSGFAAAQCKVPFSVVTQDSLGNITHGVNEKTSQWIAKTLAKKFPEMCYSDSAESLVLFFSAVPAVYHGSRQVPTKGSITNTNGERVGEVEGSQSVSYEVDYDRLYLSIETKSTDGTWKVLHRFDGKTLHPAYGPVCLRNCHPRNKMLESAMKWIHEGGLTDSTQTVSQ